MKKESPVVPLLTPSVSQEKRPMRSPPQWTRAERSGVDGMEEGTPHHGAQELEGYSHGSSAASTGGDLHELAFYGWWSLRTQREDLIHPAQAGEGAVLVEVNKEVDKLGRAGELVGRNAMNPRGHRAKRFPVRGRDQGGTEASVKLHEPPGPTNHSVVHDFSKTV